MTALHVTMTLHGCTTFALAGITPRTVLDGAESPQLSMPASGYSTAVLLPCYLFVFYSTGYSFEMYLGILGLAAGAARSRQYSALLDFPRLPQT